LLLDLSADEIVSLLDVSYLEEVLSPDDAGEILRKHQASREEREQILRAGYPGYDTSVGWFQYGDDVVRENVLRTIDAGFDAFKLKVGSKDPERDLRRAAMLREIAGPRSRVMFDANQQWTFPEAERMCRALAAFDPYWVEEPTHPDDVEAHRKLVLSAAPVKIALGEHVPNRVLFKNYLQVGAVHFVQADCTRLAGVAEFLTVSLLAKKFDFPVVPHVGDMGQIHHHLVLFNRIALAHDVVFLEHIPHLRGYFANPAAVEAGVYRTPQEPGLSCDLNG
jgi:L-fuconate dehydratase